jgi:hypothetical protein
MPRIVKIYADTLERWASELLREGKISRADYKLLIEYLRYYDVDVLDKYDKLEQPLPRNYEIFRFPTGYKPAREDYIRIVLERAKEWKEEKERERLEWEREREERKRREQEAKVLREKVKREFIGRYERILKDFERKLEKYEFDEEDPAWEWLADLKHLVYKRPESVMSEEEVRELEKTIEDLIKKIEERIKKAEEWERLSPEERERRLKRMEQEFLKLIRGEID